MIQGSEAWFAARLAKVTASRVADVVARTKSGYGASRANYMAQLIAERLTGAKAESYTNAAMQWGKETEPQARALYALTNDVGVVECGFFNHPTIGLSGASPDGLIGDDGLVEIKCPNSATHLDTLLGSPIDDKYVKQMQWQIACTGRKWCDFVSFDPRLGNGLEMKVIRVPRDDAMIQNLEEEVTAFINEMQTKLDKLLVLTLDEMDKFNG